MVVVVVSGVSPTSGWVVHDGDVYVQEGGSGMAEYWDWGRAASRRPIDGNIMGDRNLRQNGW